MQVRGSKTSPLTLGPGQVVPQTGLSNDNVVWFVVGAGGAAEVTTNPAIAAGGFIGQELTFMGTDDVKTVTFDDGNGLSLNVDKRVLGLGNMLRVMWDGDTWQEVFFS